MRPSKLTSERCSSRSQWQLRTSLRNRDSYKAVSAESARYAVGSFARSKRPAKLPVGASTNPLNRTLSRRASKFKAIRLSQLLYWSWGGCAQLPAELKSEYRAVKLKNARHRREVEQARVPRYKRTNIQQNRNPERKNKALLVSFVTQQLLSQQSAGPASCQ